jgi:hypothetical protein
MLALSSLTLGPESACRQRPFHSLLKKRPLSFSPRSRSGSHQSVLNSFDFYYHGYKCIQIPPSRSQRESPRDPLYTRSCSDAWFSLQGDRLSSTVIISLSKWEHVTPSFHPPVFARVQAHQLIHSPVDSNTAARHASVQNKYHSKAGDPSMPNMFAGQGAYRARTYLKVSVVI